MSVLKSTTTSAYAALLLAPKLLYFFAFLQQFSFYAFRSVFLHEYFRYTPWQTGLIYSLTAGASFLGMTVWGNGADRTGRPKMIFLVLVVGSVVTFMPLYVKSWFDGWEGAYYLVVVILCLYSFFNFGMNPILSNTVLEILSRAGEMDKSIYGRQVVFGSFAYVISNFCQGIANDTYGIESIFLILPLTSLALIIAVYYAFPSDVDAKKNRNSNDGTNNENFKNGSIEVSALPWWHVLKSPRFILFLTVIFLTGCARSIMSAFLPLYYKKNLNLSGRDSSLMMISGVALEMASFGLAPVISVMGPYWMLVMAQVLMAIRAWAYVLLSPSDGNFWSFMFVELLKGAAFGLTHLAGVRIACESAPIGLESTAQGFYEGFYAQIPSILSVPLGGLAIQHFGFESLFHFTASGISFSCLLVIFIFWQNGKLRFF